MTDRPTRKKKMPRAFRRRFPGPKSWLMFLIWMGAAALAALMLGQGGLQRIPGVVAVTTEAVAPLETAQLKAVYAEPGQTVKAGDLLAQMDGRILDAEMEVELLKIESRFARVIFRVETELRKARMGQASDTAELAMLNKELNRFARYAEPRNLDDAQMVAEFKARQEALKHNVELYPETVKRLEEYLTRARAQQADAAAVLGGAIKIPPDLDIDESELGLEETQHQIGLLNLRRETYSLRAERAGTVSEVLHQPGEVVKGGDPVMTLAVAGPVRVIGYMSGRNVPGPSVGETAYVIRERNGAAAIKARVTALGPEMIGTNGGLPPYRLEMGNLRRIILVPEENNAGLIPGETVTIRFSPPWWQQLLARFK